MSLRILFVSHSNPYGPFRVGSHHLAGEFADRGHEVVHLSTPLSIAHVLTGRIPVERVRAAPVDRIGQDGVRYLVPRSLLPAGVGRFRVQHTTRRLRLPRFDVVLIDQPLLWSRSLRRVGARIVYRPTDEYPEGLKARLQKDVLRHADGVVATSGEVLRRLGPLDIPSVILENGVDVRRFAPERVAARAQVCVYVGALDSRFDWDQLNAWATEFGAWRFLVAGPATEAPTRLPRNVEMLGPVRYEELPLLLSGARVGLLPLSAHSLNAGRSPMKLWEYLASGLAVVSRETPVLRPIPEMGVFTYTDATAASSALRAAMRVEIPNDAGADRAREHSWTVKGEALLEFIASLPADQRPAGSRRTRRG
ncbi:glycosyltransferase [Microbacterium sp. B2969]|uniref:Glycosyltransferase n=1 Tax=Microbacterium alkaliflavum TaxID=3248839 RepID=A0ABW7QD73_9MICO